MIARVDCAKTIQEEMKMRESKFKNYDALPLTLTAPEVGEVLGISRAAAYELVRSKGFPHIRIGTRILVPKDKFIQWIVSSAQQHLPCAAGCHPVQTVCVSGLLLRQ